MDLYKNAYRNTLEYIGPLYATFPSVVKLINWRVWMTRYPCNQGDWIATFLQFSLNRMSKTGMKHKMKPGYLHYGFIFLENCIFWFGFFSCSVSGVTSRVCSSTISLYSIWPTPVASGNTPGIAFSLCLSYFLISQNCCLLSALLCKPNPLKAHRPDADCVCGGTAASRTFSIFHCCHTTLRSGRNQDLH